MDSSGTGRPFRPMLRQGTRFDPQAAGRPILVFEDVHKAYRSDAPVLRGLNLEIARGEFVFITGPSGAGKSTLLRLLHAAGDRRLWPHPLSGSRDRAAHVELGPRSCAATSASSFRTSSSSRTGPSIENVALPLEVLGLPSRATRQRVAEALERVGLNGRGAELAGRLSGGEQQRVAVARAIVGEPALLLADEPTGNLDPQLALDILGLLERHQRERGHGAVRDATTARLLDVRPRRVVVLDEGAPPTCLTGSRN